MRKMLLFLLKPLSFLPALAVMYMIYSFSGQTGDISGNLSYEVSHKIVELGNEYTESGLSEDDVNYYASKIEYPIRKGAHMTEYFVLACCVSFPLYVYGVRGIWLMILAGMICVGYAAGDEYHQSFVDGRGPSVRDVGIDSIGVFAGIIVVRIFCYIMLTPARMMARQRRRRRRR